MKTALAIFTKTPTRSPVKTRLAANIGEAKATQFFTLSLKAIEKTAQNTNANPHWAIAEADALNDEIWKSFPALHTGGGCLGARQHHIYETLLKIHDAVILIGADAPQLSPDTINAAITTLQTNDTVIGPANDGGYYLIAGKITTPLSAWQQTPWSSENTRAELIKNLNITPYELPPLTDIDTIKDLAVLTSEMPNLMTAEQTAIINWIKTL